MKVYCYHCFDAVGCVTEHHPACKSPAPVVLKFHF